MDRGKIEQTLVNLCLNSSHALADQPGTIELLVEQVEVDGGRAGALRKAGLGAKDKRQTLSTDADGTVHLWRGILGSGTHIKLTVRDTGCGMPPEVMGRIFEPFFTTRTDHGGTGLGLSSVAEIVDLHGGAIHVRSRLGHGTAFTIMLPATADRRATEPLASPAAGTATRPAGRTPRALVVDDEPSVAEIVATTLEGEGFQVESFNESPRALARLREDPGAFDLIVTDQTMPDLTGRMLAEAAAELRGDLPVVITTGYSVEALDPASVPATVKLVLRKPFLPDELVAAARRATIPSTVS
jgi:CheY-like chemotaxis protein